MVENIIWHRVDEICTIDYSDFAVARLYTTFSPAPFLSPIRHGNTDVLGFLLFAQHVSVKILPLIDFLRNYGLS